MTIDALARFLFHTTTLTLAAGFALAGAVLCLEVMGLFITFGPALAVALGMGAVGGGMLTALG